MAYALCGLGSMRFSLGDVAGARGLLDEGLALYDKVDKDASEALHFRTLQQNLVNSGKQ